jgi:peptidoglycan/LPS O-acetylase OafA/YrhL
LRYLDGLRGAAALYVVVYHAATGYRGDRLPTWTETPLKFLTYGHFSVAVFIVLSGYSLMLPVARSPDGRLIGGVPRYLRRRARRLLPPYYAAIALSLLLIAAIPALGEPTGTMWDGTTPAFTPGALLSHLFVVHNLSEDWIFRINGPLWSVAAEWQIYFFLPFMMLPLWRRAGMITMLFAAFAVGYLPHFALGGLLEKTYPWYLGLFALGGCGALINFSPSEEARRLREGVPWGVVAAVLWSAAGLVGFGFARFWWSHLWLADTIVGLATASLLVRCTRDSFRHGAPSRSTVLGVLGSRPLVGVGRFSYSLYLVHMPVLAVVYLASRTLPPGVARFAITQAAMLSVAVGSAFLFHRVVERRFM